MRQTKRAFQSKSLILKRWNFSLLQRDADTVSTTVAASLGAAGAIGPTMQIKSTKSDSGSISSGEKKKILPECPSASRCKRRFCTKKLWVKICRRTYAANTDPQILKRGSRCPAPSNISCIQGKSPLKISSREISRSSNRLHLNCVTNAARSSSVICFSSQSG